MTTPSPCRDCAIDTTPHNGAWQYYVVTDDVWLAAGMPHASERSPGGDFLCYSCLEARLGRKLTPRDFSDAPINLLNPRASDGAPLLRSLRSYRVLRSYQQEPPPCSTKTTRRSLSLPLGAGKGAAALTAIAELIRDGHRRHALVIAPKLVATTVWPAEVASWPHLAHLRVAVLDGAPARRRALLATAAKREVTVIGIDLVPWLVGELAAVAGRSSAVRPAGDRRDLAPQRPERQARPRAPEGRGAVPDALGPDRHPATKLEPGPVHADRHHHRWRAVGPRLRALAEAVFPALRSVRARMDGAAGGRGAESPPTSAPSR